MPEIKKILSTLALSAISTFLAGFISFASSQETVEISGQLQTPVKSQPVFEIQGSDNLSGFIKIYSNPENDVQISYIKKAQTESHSQSSLFLDLIDVQLLSSSSDRIILKILTPRDSPWEGSNYSVRLEITALIPEQLFIEAGLRFMELSVNGPFRGASIIGAYSPIEIFNINGQVKVSTSFSDVNISDIHGELSVENHHGSIIAQSVQISSGVAIFRNTYSPIKLQDITGGLEAYTDFSEIRAKDINAGDGSIVLRTNYGPIIVENITGEIICETSFNSIDITGARLTHGHSKIETNYSKINSEFEELSDCDLFISNTYNNINLKIPASISAEIVASVDDGGRINVENLPIRPTLLQMKRFEGYLGDFDSRVELKISGIGTININGK